MIPTGRVDATFRLLQVDQNLRSITRGEQYTCNRVSSASGARPARAATGHNENWWNFDFNTVLLSYIDRTCVRT